MAELSIKILGPGCANCVRLAQNAQMAATLAGVEASFSKVTDMAAIMAYGILRTPGLVVNEKVLVSGRVPEPAEIAQLLANQL